MIYIDVQNTKIPALGYGTWNLRGGECLNGVEQALEIGYRHIDTAQIYENEAEVGAGIAVSGVKRSDIFLTTKVWVTDVAEGALQKSVDESLSKLRTDYVDLLLIHWPVMDVPFAEQMKALQSVQKDGKTKLLGISNYTLAHMKEAVETLGVPVVTNQVEYHPYLSQKLLYDYMRAHGMFLTAYCPIARGKVVKDPVITKIAEQHGKTPGQVTLRWLVQQDGVAAIPKAASEKHMRENFAIFDFTLTAEEMQAIAALARPDGRIVSPAAIAPIWDQAA
jgi:2,5-diketo-D-gluconate reductase B